MLGVFFTVILATVFAKGFLLLLMIQMTFIFAKNQAVSFRMRTVVAVWRFWKGDGSAWHNTALMGYMKDADYSL